MNTIKTLIIALFASCMFACGLTQPTPDDVAEKILNGETLESDDYATMQDYLNNFCDEGEDSDNTYEAAQEVARKYPYFMTFALKLENAPSDVKDDLDISNTLNRFMLLMNR